MCNSVETDGREPGWGNCPNPLQNMECIDRVNAGSNTVAVLQKNIKQSDTNNWGMLII
ncbi:MAG TPA: hypothetical protein VJ440_06255 [Candidatus Brocadiaceae bacterium]|nr:hypothetical protein [Candidatus Brocadiaceae bacterium]